MQNRQAQLALARRRRLRMRLHKRPQNIVGLHKPPTAHVHGLVVVAGADQLGYLLRLAHILHQRRVDDLVVADAEQLRLLLGAGRQDMLHGGRAQHRAHGAIEGARRAAALDVTQQRDARVLGQPLGQHLLDVLALDRLAMPVDRALGHDHDIVPAPALAAGVDRRAHRRLPAVVGRALGDEDPVGTGGHAAHQRQVAGVPAHHLDDEAALVAGGRAGDRVQRLDDPAQRRVGADGHVGAEHIVVDRADQAHDRQVRVRGGDVS